MIVNNKKLNVLVLGASGMLGNTLFRLFSQSDTFNTTGTVRSPGAPGQLPVAMHKNIVQGLDVGDMTGVARVVSRRSWIQRFCGTSVMYMYSVPIERQ